MVLLLIIVPILAPKKITFLQAPISLGSNNLPLRQRSSHSTRNCAQLSTPARFVQTLEWKKPPSEGTQRGGTDKQTALLSRIAALAPFFFAVIGTPAEAAGEEFAGAFIAYGHYLAIVMATACLVAERFIIKPNMTPEEESTLRNVDVAYGLSGLLSIVTGYFRVTQFGKGWSFYQHEPIFWLKVVFVAIAGSVSFFITTTIVKRAVEQRSAGDAGIAPMSEKLAHRMTSLVNAQLLAIGSIPLTATLMARGVGYVEWFPWEAGLASATLALGTFGFKYIKEALDWSDGDEGNPDTSSLKASSGA